MTVRRAVEADLAAVAVLLQRLVPLEADRRQAVWNDALRREGYAAWVAEADRRPVAFLDLFVLPDVSHDRPTGIINNLVVDAAFRERGLGERLVREAIRHCRRHGAVELHVWTGFDNAPALALYRKTGFADRALLLELELDAVLPEG